MSRSYHLTTFGCQMNEHDSERMKGMLESLGYGEAEERADADLILFNTCSIRESADSRFIGHLGEAKRLKSEDPSRVVGVGGCWSQSLKEKVFEQFPFVDVAFGPGQVHRLAEFLTSDSLTAQGYFEFEGFTGHLPMKRERMERLVEAVQRLATERAQRFVGRTVEVLAEGPSRTDPSKIRGRTAHGKTINFEGLARPGEMTDVEVTSATSTTLAGHESLLARVG